MQSKSFYTVCLLILFWLNLLQSQSLTDSLGIEDSTTGLKIAQAITPVDSLLTDTIPTKQPTLLDQVKYNAKEYVRITR